MQLIPDDINMSLWAVIPNNSSTNKTEEMRWQKKKVRYYNTRLNKS
jgi:hypothetical protein